MSADAGQPALTTSRARGSAAVHLVMHGPRGHEPQETLCDLPVRFPKPTRRFHDSGCQQCADRALVWGMDTVQDSDNAWVNLRRIRTGLR